MLICCSLPVWRRPRPALTNQHTAPVLLVANGPIFESNDSEGVCTTSIWDAAARVRAEHRLAGTDCATEPAPLFNRFKDVRAAGKGTHVACQSDVSLEPRPSQPRSTKDSAGCPHSFLVQLAGQLRESMVTGATLTAGTSAVSCASKLADGERQNVAPELEETSSANSPTLVPLPGAVHQVSRVLLLGWKCRLRGARSNGGWRRTHRRGGAAQGWGPVG
jgi:hypothetical protein